MMYTPIVVVESTKGARRWFRPSVTATLHCKLSVFPPESDEVKYRQDLVD